MAWLTVWTRQLIAGPSTPRENGSGFWYRRGHPKENARITEQMLTLGGALIPEFPMSTFGAPQNCPIRNRIISGISIGVLVVEAAEYSDTRMTSRCALDQNREVFAVPVNAQTRIPGDRTG